MADESATPPVRIGVPMIGDDRELAVIGAIVFLLDQEYFPGPSLPSGPLTAEEKQRVVGYLMERYGAATK